MEPAGGLDRVRRPGPGAVRVGASAVSADDLDAGVRGQPVRQRPGVAAFEEVQRSAGLDVDDERAVVLAAPDREVVNPGHPRRCRVRVGDGHDQPEHDLARRRNPQAGGQPGSRPPGERDRDAPGHAGQQRRLPRVAAGQPVDLLRERLAPAIGGRAEKPADGPARSPPAGPRSRHRPASWNSGCGPGPTSPRTPGTPPWPPSPWPSRAAARPPPRPPRRPPRPGAAAERPGQPNQGTTRTRRLATMTPRAPGRTAGLDNRWTTRGPLTSHRSTTTMDISGASQRAPRGRHGQAASRNWGQIRNKPS